MNDPEFVRLRDGVTILVDMDAGGSHWSISGFDVKEFPDDDDYVAQRFVRAKVNAGVLLEASSAEYDAVHPEGSNEGPPVVIFKEAPSNWQENDIQAAARTQRKAMRVARGIDPAAPEPRASGVFGETEEKSVIGSNHPVRDEEADQERRQALIDEQHETGQLTDDPEEQKERSAGRAASAAKKSGGRKSKAKEKEPVSADAE